MSNLVSQNLNMIFKTPNGETVHALKDVNFNITPYGIKEIGSVFFTAFLHLFLKNYLILRQYFICAIHLGF